jgi:hypothetical protein
MRGREDERTMKASREEIVEMVRRLRNCEAALGPQAAECEVLRLDLIEVLVDPVVAEAIAVRLIKQCMARADIPKRYRA